MVKKILIFTAFVSIISGAAAGITLSVYESDSLTPFDGRNIMVGTSLKLVVASDANDFWCGGLFLNGNSRNLAVLSGTGNDLNSSDYLGSHGPNAGLEAWVTRWEDSVIEGFDLFSDINCVPGSWFVIDYTALAPGDPNVGFYEYSVSWDDPNSFVMFHQVPTADFNIDGIVNFLDYSLLASCWQEDDCTDPDGCQKADLDTDGVVDIKDLLIFSEYWLWGAPEPNELHEPNEPSQGNPLPDPNLIYQIVDANGLNEITLDVGQTVTLYVDMVTHDANNVWSFGIEVDISDPNLGTIDNTAYDPNNPPGPGTARILAEPNRWTLFDRWKPGYLQQEGIYFTGLSKKEALLDGHLVSFEFTCQGAGDVILSLFNRDTTSIAGENLYPTLKGMLIHQNAPSDPIMMSSKMSLATSTSTERAVPSMSPEEFVQILEVIWLTNDKFQEAIPEEDWLEFIGGLKQSYPSELLEK